MLLKYWRILNKIFVSCRKIIKKSYWLKGVSSLAGWTSFSLRRCSISRSRAAVLTGLALPNIDEEGMAAPTSSTGNVRGCSKSFGLSFSSVGAAAAADSGLALIASGCCLTSSVLPQALVGSAGFSSVLAQLFSLEIKIFFKIIIEENNFISFRFYPSAPSSESRCCRGSGRL